MLKTTGSLSLEEKQQALQVALESRVFKRSEQMRSFLRYVCEAEFRGDGANINEYVIGTEVLHRPAGYSPAEDSSVRTRAYELRQKLERLYTDELIGEELRIVIPKGAYTPQFIKVPSVAELPIALPPSINTPVVNPDAKQVDVKPRSLRPRFVQLAVFAALALLFIALGWVIARAWYSGGTSPASPTKFTDNRGVESEVSSPQLKQAWESVAKPRSQTLLVAATPLYMVLGPETHRAYGTPTYRVPAEAYSLFRKHRPLSPGAHLGMLFTEDALGVGNMDAVVIASNTIRALGGDTEILPERASMMSALHGRNVVVFGAPVDSTLISQLLEKTPLTVDYEETAKEFTIRDRSNGQVLVPEKTPDGDFRYVYGLITVLNTRESAHGGLGTIVFSGITSVGTHGAAEYFASQRSLKTLMDAFAKSGVNRWPAAYQVVVKCKIENLLLVSEEYQTHRILQAD